MFDAMLADAHRRGSLYRIAGVYLWRGFTLFRRGDLVDAEELLRSAFDQAERWGYGADTLQWNAAILAAALTERGDLAGARQALARAARAGRHLRRRALLVQRPAGAAGRRGPLGAGRRGGRRVPRAGFPFHRNPAGALGLAEGRRAARAGGRRKALELAAEELDRARDWGAPGTVARSLRVLGTLEGTGGLERLEEAVELVSRAPSRLELAKALHALAVARRQAGRPDYAREPLLARACARRGVRGRAAARADPRRDAARRRRAGRARAAWPR